MVKKKDVSAREMQKLPVRLTDDELLGYGDQAARLIEAAATLEALASAWMQGYDLLRKKRRAEVEELRQQGYDLLRRVRMKHEDREVECERIADFGVKKLRVTRLDTGEIVQERALTFDELQGRLFVVEPAAKKGEE